MTEKYQRLADIARELYEILTEATDAGISKECLLVEIDQFFESRIPDSKPIETKTDIPIQNLELTND